MLILIAKFKIRSESTANMLNLAKGMLKPSNNENGCISYEFFQNPFQNNYFIFIEKWQSKKSLDLHFKTTHFKNFDTKVTELISEKPSVISYEVKSEEKII